MKMKEEPSVFLYGVSHLLFHKYTPNFHTTLHITLQLATKILVRKFREKNQRKNFTFIKKGRKQVSAKKFVANKKGDVGMWVRSHPKSYVWLINRTT
jgi:hypothetical protein